MKSRNGFVSNSSSSSFVLAMRPEHDTDRAIDELVRKLFRIDESTERLVETLAFMLESVLFGRMKDEEYERIGISCADRYFDPGIDEIKHAKALEEDGWDVELITIDSHIANDAGLSVNTRVDGRSVKLFHV